MLRYFFHPRLNLIDGFNIASIAPIAILVGAPAAIVISFLIGIISGQVERRLGK